MTRDDVIRMAEEAGFSIEEDWLLVLDEKNKHPRAEMPTLLRFARLVAAHEREACAKVCDQQAHEPECPERADYCAAAIRARGQS